MIGIANRSGGYEESVVEMIDPLLATCGNIVGSLEAGSQRIEAEEALRKASEQLAVTVDHMTKRNERILLLIELEELLQACETLKEAYEVVAHIAKGLFPGFGVLQLVAPRTADAGSVISEINEIQELAITVSSRIAVTFANLRLSQNLKEQSLRDPLTNLYNRRRMNDALDREVHRVRRSPGSSLSVIQFDLDHFKRINDEFGHSAGDALLSEFADILRDCSRGFGVATAPECANNSSGGLIRAADAALYEAKAAGRNCVVATQESAAKDADLTLSMVLPKIEFDH